MSKTTEKKLLIKIRKALENGIITPYQLSVLLHYRTKNQLYMLMNALNEMYSNNEIVPVIEEDEKSLLLVRR